MLLRPHRRLLKARGKNWSELVRAAVIVCYGDPAAVREFSGEFERATELKAAVAARLVPKPPTRASSEHRDRPTKKAKAAKGGRRAGAAATSKRKPRARRTTASRAMPHAKRR